MGVPGVAGHHTQTNHIMEIVRVLGIEAARKKITTEIRDTMGAFGMVIDNRHTMLLADCMTYKVRIRVSENSTEGLEQFLLCHDTASCDGTMSLMLR